MQLYFLKNEKIPNKNRKMEPWQKKILLTWLHLH